MKKPDIPAHESARLAALCRLSILDTPAEERFDRITRIAQQHFQVPIALVSLIDTERQWFKSRQGLNAVETPRDISFCGHAILSDDILCIPNALADPRFEDNPLVTGAPNIRFYAGAPLHAPGGERVGTLCIIDGKPRTFTADDLNVLRDLADCVETELDRTRIVAAAHEAHRFKQILDKTRDMIFMFDVNSLQFVYLNQGAVQSMGYTSKELLQLHPYDINPQFPEPLFRLLIAPLLSGEQDILQFETLQQRKDGVDFPVEINLQLVREPDSVGRFVAIVRDITERQRIDKMKREFISTVSHELRTPLTSIRGALGLVAGGATGVIPAQALALVNIANNNCERLVRLTNDILDMEKIESGKMQFDLRPVDPQGLIEEAIAANQAFATQHQVTIALEGELPTMEIIGDRDRLLQVLTNLLSNASKFSPAGGTVRVSMTETPGALLFRVRDEGPGVPAEFQPRIFQKFSQADASDTRSKGGTGLGLSITKAIVEQHGGQIGFETGTGKGATFWVRLPARPLIEFTEHPPGKIRVLVVEDDQDIAKLLRLILEREGYAADVAYSLAQAREHLLTAHYAAITLDLLLPGESGIAFVRELRERPESTTLPIVVISAVVESGHKALDRTGVMALDWLSKPIDEKRLLKAVAEAVQVSAAYVKSRTDIEMPGARDSQ